MRSFGSANVVFHLIDDNLQKNQLCHFIKAMKNNDSQTQNAIR